MGAEFCSHRAFIKYDAKHPSTLYNESMLTQSIINRAFEEVSKSPHPTFMHGAVLFNKRRIVKSSTNQFTYSAFATRFGSGEAFTNCHAEIGAILNVPRDVACSCSILVIRATRLGKLQSSMPCQMCQNALKYMGIKTVYHSTTEGEIVKIKLQCGV